ncbi:MAG: PKD domain-containing protein, partial [Bacteroidota bacterium]
MVSAVGGTQPYTLTFAANGNTLWTLPFNQGTQHNLSFLQEEVYSVTVTDAVGKKAYCQFILTVDPNDCWVSIFPTSIEQPTTCSSYGSLGAWTKFNSTNFGNNTFFHWNNGLTGSIFSFSVGTYTVTVTNNNGCSSSETLEFTCSNATCPTSASLCVKILAPPKSAFSATPMPTGNTLQICQGQEVFFENTSQDAATYAWIFGDGSTSAQASPNHTYLVPGTFTAALIARNDCFCADTAFLTIEVLPANLPEIDCVGSVCESDVVTYSTDAGCSSFDWSVSGNAAVLGGGGAGDDFITVEWQPGQAEGWISLQTSACAGAAECAAANVVPIAILSDEVQIQGLDKVCDGATVEYFIPDFQGTEIGWQVSGAGEILSGQGTSRIVIEWSAGLPNPQQVIVWFDNCFLGCSGQDTLLVSIRNEFYVEGGIEFCQNDAGQFSARNTVTNALVPCHWQVLNAAGSAVWSSAAPVSSASIFFNFPGGNYTVRAVPASLSSFCNDRFDVPVHVFANPAAVGGIVGDLQICPGETYTYSAQGLGQNGFEWTIQNGSATSTATGNPINVTWGSASPRTLTVSQISANGLLCASEPFTLNVSEFPPVSIAGEPEVCLEETASYSASPAQNVDYQWEISPPEAGAILSGQGTASVFVFWRQPGNAAVKLTTCTASTSFPVNVLPLPQPFVPDGAVCQSMAMQVQTNQPFSSYVWRNSSLAIVSTSATPTLVPGMYTVQVTDQNGCPGKDIFNIGQHPAPIFHLSVPVHIGLCPGGSGTTIHASTEAAGLDYQWFFNGTPTGGNASSLPVNLPGIYRVIATDPHGCTADEILTLPDCEDIGGTCVNGLCIETLPPCDPGGNLSFEIQPTADCQTRHYENTSVNFIPGSMWWAFGNGEVSVAFSPTITYSHPGFYGAILNGDVVNLSPPPPSCKDQFWLQDTVLALANFESASGGCPGSPVQFTDRTEHMEFATLSAWQWDFGDPASGAANVSNEQNPTHTYATAGTYQVTLTVNGSGGGSCQTSHWKNIVVNPLPTVSFVPPTAGCGGSAFSFSATTSANIADFHWDFGDPASGIANFSTKADPLHVFDAPGTYQATLTVTNSLGCMADFSAPVQVVANNLTGGISFSQPPPICAGDS